MTYRWSTWSLIHGAGLIGIISADCEYVSDDVRRYLLLFLCSNAIFEIMKLMAFGCLLERFSTSPENTEERQMKLLAVQTVANLAIYLRGQCWYPDEVTDWFWASNGRPWYVNFVAYSTGLTQYFFFFLFAMMSVVALIVSIGYCILRCFGPRRDQRNETNFDRDQMDENREAIMTKLNKLGHIFSFYKTKE